MSISDADRKEAQERGERIRELRKGLGLSQDKLAAMAGLSKSYICLLERPTKSRAIRPSMGTINALAECLKVTRESLYSGCQDEEEDQAEYVKQRFVRLDARGKDMVLAALEAAST